MQEILSPPAIYAGIVGIGAGLLLEATVRDAKFKPIWNKLSNKGRSVIHGEQLIKAGMRRGLQTGRLLGDGG